jgi:DNA mismatch repair ATPase MutS
VNMVLHYKNKGKISQYTHSLPQLIKLYQVAQRLIKTTGVKRNDKITGNIMSLGKLKRSLGFISFQNRIGGDPSDVIFAVMELIKTLFLLEALMFIRSLNKVEKYRGDIAAVYEYVAEIDMLIAISSIRLSLPFYCKPVFTGDNELKITDLYHPLIADCVSNSIVSSSDKGALITGSNMSGKTTFIRSIAINTLFAQTLFTCCAREYRSPLLKLHTSVRVSDAIDEQKSYFQAEALSVLDILKQCGANQPVKSLVIIDEIFRGTNTIERIAAAKAVLAYLTANRNFVFVSTHDLELAELLGSDYVVYSFEESVADERLVFDYKLKTGMLKNKNGIAVLQSVGYPASVIQDAYKVSDELRKKYQLECAMIATTG